MISAFLVMRTLGWRRALPAAPRAVVVAVSDTQLVRLEDYDLVADPDLLGAVVERHVLLSTELHQRRDHVGRPGHRLHCYAARLPSCHSRIASCTRSISAAPAKCGASSSAYSASSRLNQKV